MKKRLRDRLPGFTLIELMIIVAIIGILLALVFEPGRDERCRELCAALNKKTVGTVHTSCICEDPRTGERDAYGTKMAPLTR